MKEIIERIERLKNDLEKLRFSDENILPTDLQRSRDIELTYTSNAIEGNTLTLDQTTSLIERGTTAPGKKMTEHQEAIDHHKALEWVKEMARVNEPIDDETVLRLHQLTMQTSRADIAGRYADFPRRISGMAVIFPNHRKVPDLMRELGATLRISDGSPKAAFDAHHRIVSIHPFDDGNGRTARLLMNLMLLRGGYVPVAVGPKDRQEYIDSINKAQMDGDEGAPDFQRFMHGQLASTMQEYVDDLSEGAEGAVVSEKKPLTPTQIAFMQGKDGMSR